MKVAHERHEADLYLEAFYSIFLLFLQLKVYIKNAEVLIRILMILLQTGFLSLSK